MEVTIIINQMNNQEIPHYRNNFKIQRGRRGRDHMAVRFTTIYAISTHHHESCEFESH